MRRIEPTFLLLVIVQALHSVEEYRGRLYDAFPPAHFVSALISENLALGFGILNLALVTFGLWCFLWPILRGWPSATLLARTWVAIELVNGLGHPLWTLAAHRYTPGVATAPFLLLIALYLAWQLRAWEREQAAPGYCQLR